MAGGLDPDVLIYARDVKGEDPKVLIVSFSLPFCSLDSGCRRMSSGLAECFR